MNRLGWSAAWLVAAAVAGVAACASTEAPVGVSPDDSVAVPDPALPPDAGADAAPADAEPCADCEYFPEPCTADALCPNGPFDPKTAGGSLDPRARITVIRGRSPSDVWAAGALGTLAHFDGTSWRRSDLGSDETLKALWLRNSGEVAVGMLDRIYARGLDGGDAGTAPSADGWALHKSSAAPVYQEYKSLVFQSAWAAPGAESLWCATFAWHPGRTSGLWRLRHSPSSTFEIGVGVEPALCHQSLPCSQMTSIHGASANALWAVGTMGAAIRVTNAESDTPTVAAFDSQTWDALLGVWAASESEAWAVGMRGTIRHYTGDPSAWDVVADVPTTENLNAVWGSSPSDVWAVGDAGVVLHYDGKAWSRKKVAGLGARRPNLTTVWAAPGHVWIGGQGVFLSLGAKS
ncbi:MAG: hypothetical protein BGO98_04675 [Myxococcales bacterium 68-20]|nr:hypothetical protein [Myxococcales bacterium]OJY20587.1 MAG: hypothetical protein BGO98_04675 [Myxococcales bacterium 68-20]